MNYMYKGMPADALIVPRKMKLTLLFIVACEWCTVQWESFEGENFRKFRGVVAIRESFLCEIWGEASFGTAKPSNWQKFSL